MADFPSQDATPQKKSGLSPALMVILVGLFVCFCLVPFVIICLLALLGPAIGNVFSDVIDSLSTPTPSFVLLKNLILTSLPW